MATKRIEGGATKSTEGGATTSPDRGRGRADRAIHMAQRGRGHGWPPHLAIAHLGSSSSPPPPSWLIAARCLRAVPHPAGISYALWLGPPMVVSWESRPVATVLISCAVGARRPVAAHAALDFPNAKAAPHETIHGHFMIAQPRRTPAMAGDPWGEGSTHGSGARAGVPSWIPRLSMPSRHPAGAPCLFDAGTLRPRRSPRGIPHRRMEAFLRLYQSWPARGPRLLTARLQWSAAARVGRRQTRGAGELDHYRPSRWPPLLRLAPCALPLGSVFLLSSLDIPSSAASRGRDAVTPANSSPPPYVPRHLGPRCVLLSDLLALLQFKHPYCTTPLDAETRSAPAGLWLPTRSPQGTHEVDSEAPARRWDGSPEAPPSRDLRPSIPVGMPHGYIMCRPTATPSY